MANFIGLVYATLKNEGIDTKDMSTDEAVKKYNELQKKSGGKAGEKEGTPAEQKRLKEIGVDEEKASVNKFDEEKTELNEYLNNKHTAQEDFNKKYDFFSKYQKGKANKDNFFFNTIATFQDIGKRPRRPPDYVSYGYGDKISSEYWYENGFLIRGSNHWGNGIATCDWDIDSINLKKKHEIETTNKRYGKVDFNDIKFKTYTQDFIGTNLDNKKEIIGFDNIVDRFKGGRIVYDVDNEIYVTSYQFPNKAIKAVKTEYGYMPDDDIENKLKQNKQEQAVESFEQERKKLLEQKDIFNPQSEKAPNIGDKFLNKNNKVLKVSQVENYEYGGKYITLENGEHYLMRNVK